MDMDALVSSSTNSLINSSSSSHSNNNNNNSLISSTVIGTKVTNCARPLSTYRYVIYEDMTDRIETNAKRGKA